MPRTNLHRRITTSLWRLCFVVTLSGALLGSFGISVERNVIISSEQHAEASQLHSNGNGNVPWYYLTIYTIGIVFLSYYLGGAFSSVAHLEGREEGQPLATLLRLRTELKFLPISHFIRSQTKQNELRVVIPNNLQICPENGTTIATHNISGQTEVLIDAILQGYVFPWYNRISDERTFPEHSKQILHFVFERLREKIRKVNRNALAKEVIQTMHYHWKEYCAASEKKQPTTEDVANNYTFTHPYVNNREELSKHYESLLCLLLKSLVPPGLDYHVFCQFMAGILVKGVFLYYAELMSDPKWVNTTLVTLISSGSFTNETSSNASGSNRSTAPPSPSPLTESRLEEPERTEPTLVSPSSSLKEKGALDSEPVLDGMLEFQQKQDALLEVVATKGSIHNFLRLDSSRALDKKGPSKSSGMNSIQAALTGLLSATALPLLPDGSSYQRANQETSEKLPLETTILGSGICAVQEPDYEDMERPRDWSTDLNAERGSPTRHHSWEDGLKQKSGTNRGKGSQSLDENKASHAVARQEEFDMSFEKTGETKQGPCETVNLVEASPMYDEAEDFAATIAKLRSLLEQRESRTNLMEEHQTDSVENSEVFQTESRPPPPRGNGGALESGVQSVKTALMKIRPSLNSQSSASSLTSDASSGSGSNFSHGSLDTERLDTIEDNGEESDPVISRFFLNVVINKTESCGDAAGQFTLYCIQYEGVYIDGESEDSLPKLVLRTTTVKRSFKEFLLLQGQLEDSPIWRPHLRGIKTPSKWLNLSFPNQNSGNQRRLLLERYLQQICSHSILGFCPEVRHFMAYGDDGFQIFGLPTSNNFPSQRFDKLTKTFTGVLNSLRDALPSFESDLQATQQNAETSGRVVLTEHRSKKLIPSIFQFGEKVPPDEVKMDGEAFQMLKGTCEDRDAETQNPSESGSDSAKETNDHDQSTPSECANAEFNPPATEFVVDGKSIVESYPLALAMTELLCDVLWLPQRRPHSASVSAFISISGKSLENYLQETLDIFLSEEAFSGYLEWLTSCITEWADASEVKPEREECLYTADDLRRCFKQKIPVWVRWMWGRNQLDVTIERLVGFFQHSRLNHDHILSLIELIFSKLSTETTEVNAEEK